MKKFLCDLRKNEDNSKREMIDVLWVGPVCYAVRQVKRLLAEDGIKKLNGWIRYDQSEILVERELSEQRKMLTVLHEAAHAIFENAGTDVDDEEKVCDVIAHGMMGIIRDNPELIDWITNMEKSA